MGGPYLLGEGKSVELEAGRDTAGGAELAIRIISVEWKDIFFLRTKLGDWTLLGYMIWYVRDFILFNLFYLIII